MRRAAPVEKENDLLPAADGFFYGRFQAAAEDAPVAGFKLVFHIDDLHLWQ
jgi:hypothetical protein